MFRNVLIGVVLVVVIGTVVLLLQTGDDAIRNHPSHGTTIVAFGDSLVEGVGAETEGGFVTMLSARLGEPIVNLGVAGNTTADGLARIDEVLAYKPKVVMVLLGGNDALRRVPEEETIANLRAIITHIQDDGAIVLLLGVRGGLIGDDYRRVFKDLAKEYKTAYVPDVLDGVIGNPKYVSDPIHPNEAGYSVIADRIQPILIGLLN